jgi:hypothetical protein
MLGVCMLPVMAAVMMALSFIFLLLLGSDMVLNASESYPERKQHALLNQTAGIWKGCSIMMGRNISGRVPAADTAG